MTLWPTQWQLRPESWNLDVPDKLPYWSDNPCSLFELRQLFHHCQVGAASSMPAFGRRLLYLNWQAGQHPIPCNAAITDLKHFAAPRLQFLRARQPRERSHELDRAAAYPFFARKLPTGTTIRLRHTTPESIACWFRECLITVKYNLPLGPFPYRDQNRTIWPVQPGDYRTWLWSDQATACSEAGCIVLPGPGWGWHSWTADADPWVNEMLLLRRNAPGGGWNSPIGTVIKTATNAAIGSWGTAGTYLKKVKPGNRSKPGITQNGQLENWDTIEVTGSPSMVHWQRYIEMSCALDAYRRALPYAIAGSLLAVEVDKLIVSRKVRISA